MFFAEFEIITHFLVKIWNTVFTHAIYGLEKSSKGKEKFLAEFETRIQFLTKLSNMLQCYGK